MVLKSGYHQLRLVVEIPLFMTGFSTIQTVVLSDFSHQQYDPKPSVEALAGVWPSQGHFGRKSVWAFAAAREHTEAATPSARLNG